MRSNFPPPTGFANSHEARDFEEYTLTGVAAYLVEGSNTIALQGINTSTGSSDLTTEAELVFTGSSGGTPTNSDPSPGAPNSVFVNNPSSCVAPGGTSAETTVH